MACVLIFLLWFSLFTFKTSLSSSDPNEISSNTLFLVLTGELGGDFPGFNFSQPNSLTIPLLLSLLTLVHNTSVHCTRMAMKSTSSGNKGLVFTCDVPEMHG